jgi:hypothetical protein
MILTQVWTGPGALDVLLTIELDVEDESTAELVILAEELLDASTEDTTELLLAIELEEASTEDTCELGLWVELEVASEVEAVVLLLMTESEDDGRITELEDASAAEVLIVVALEDTSALSCAELLLAYTLEEKPDDETVALLSLRRVLDAA